MGTIGFEPTTFPTSRECSKPAELSAQAYLGVNNQQKKFANNYPFERATLIIPPIVDRTTFITIPKKNPIQPKNIVVPIPNVVKGIMSRNSELSPSLDIIDCEPTCKSEPKIKKMNETAPPTIARRIPASAPCVAASCN